MLPIAQVRGAVKFLPIMSEFIFPAVLLDRRSVVRHFGVLAEKNHLVFVEALFQHPHPQPFCETLHNVYHEEDYCHQEVRTAIKSPSGVPP